MSDMRHASQADARDAALAQPSLAQGPHAEPQPVRALPLEHRMELLKLELQSLGSVLDKYDDMILRQRNWFITLWMACTGAALSLKSPQVMLLGVVLALVYFAMEGITRYQSWFKYVVRYRTLRDALNNGRPLDALSVYDLTNKYMDDHETATLRLRKSVLKWDAVFIYVIMATGSVVMWWMLTNLRFADVPLLLG